MKILKTLVGSDDGNIYKVDTVEYQGGLWLCAEWLTSPTEGWTTPKQLIRMDVLQHQRTPNGAADYMLNYPIPRAVLDGDAERAKAGGFVVISRPDVKFSLPDKMN